MGLSHYPSAAEGMLPLILMNTVLSVALLKNLVRSVLQVMGGIENPSSNLEENPYEEGSSDNQTRKRRISVTSFKTLSNTSSSMECSVCLHRFEPEEKVSELSCNHFFHKSCLEKWLDHKHSTCPLCRSTL